MSAHGIPIGIWQTLFPFRTLTLVRRLHASLFGNSRSQFAGNPSQAQPCAPTVAFPFPEEYPFPVLDYVGGPCKHYICPFISSAPTKNSSSEILSLITPGRDVDIPPMMPTIVVAYNFSDTSGPRDEVEITFVMTLNATYTTTPVRLTRGGHDVVSYTLDFWEELDYGLFPSFWRLLSPVRLHQH